MLSIFCCLIKAELSAEGKSPSAEGILFSSHCSLLSHLDVCSLWNGCRSKFRLLFYTEFSLARSLGDATPPAALWPACRQPGKQSISGSARVTAKVTQKMPIPSALELWQNTMEIEKWNVKTNDACWNNSLRHSHQTECFILGTTKRSAKISYFCGNANWNFG